MPITNAVGIFDFMETGQDALNRWEKKLTQKDNIKKSWWFRITRKRWFNDWYELNATQKVIMLTLWLYAGKKDYCYPSQQLLAKELNISPNTIKRNIKILNHKGFIKIEKLVNQRGKYNRYTLVPKWDLGVSKMRLR
jgi:Transcriptional regulators